MLSQQAMTVKSLLKQAKESGEPVTSVEQQRNSLEALALLSPMASGTTVTATTLGGIESAIVESSQVATNNVLFYIHGGAYTAGSISTHRSLVSRICQVTQARAYMVEYRRAPEHPFPAALQDVLAAYQGLIDAGISPQRLVVSGDSAGGGLTLALMLKLKELNLELPLRMVLISPWTDLTGTARSITERADLDPFLHSDSLVPAAMIYLNGEDPRNPFASPLFGDLSGLPESLVLVGSDEILFDDSFRLVQALQEAGSPARLVIGEGMWHVWPAFPMMPESDDAIAEIATFICAAPSISPN